MAPEPVNPRKQPRQRRSAATVDAILTAAARVLAAESLAGFNTNRVATVAGVSVGSLYQYFPNKAALVAALIEREQAALAQAVEDCVRSHDGARLETTIAALVDIAIEHQFGNATYAAALDHEERRLPLADVLNHAQARLIGAVQALLERHRRDLAHLPTEAAKDCLLIAKALVEGESAARPPPDLKARVLRAVLGYLGYHPGRSHAIARQRRAAKNASSRPAARSSAWTAGEQDGR